MPAVLVNRAEAAARASTVISDDINGMRLAVEHLVGLGHRRIGHIAGPRHLSTGFLRRQGFEQAMTAADLDAGAVAVASAYTRDAGRVAAAELLDSHCDLTAVATANDLLALGLYLEMRARGLDCPVDLSVVGHNDMPMIDMVDPPLTTIHIHHGDMGRRAAELLLKQIGKPDAAPIVQVIEPELVLRGSHDGASGNPLVKRCRPVFPAEGIVNRSGFAIPFSATTAPTSRCPAIGITHRPGMRECRSRIPRQETGLRCQSGAVHK